VAFLRDESRRYKPVQPSVAAQFIALANKQHCLTTRPRPRFFANYYAMQTWRKPFGLCYRDSIDNYYHLLYCGSRYKATGNR